MLQGEVSKFVKPFLGDSGRVSRNMMELCRFSICLHRLCFHLGQIW